MEFLIAFFVICWILACWTAPRGTFKKATCGKCGKKYQHNPEDPDFKFTFSNLKRCKTCK